jgi:CRP-like cAMP-binding protein
LEAIRFICKFGGKDRTEVLDSLLKSHSHSVRGAAVCFIANHPTEERLFPAAQKVLEKMIKSEDEEVRREAARAIGAINGRSSLHYGLFDLLNDSSLEVVQEALISAGELRRLEYAPFVILKLESRSTRAIAGEALVKYGPKILGTLRDYLLDENADIEIRRSIPLIISRIGSEEAVDILTNSLHQQNPKLQLKVIKALNKIRVQSPINSETDSEWNSQTAKIEEQLLSDVKEYYETVMLLHVYNPEYQWSFSRQRRDLVHCCLEEKLEILLERIFRLLGLIYPPTDLYHAYHGLSSENAIIRANSLELLDNLLESEHKNMVFPIIDDDINRNYLLEVGESLGIGICKSRVEVLESLLESNEPLILLCAIEAVHNQQIEKLYPLVEKALSHPEEMVRGTAERVMGLIQARTQTLPGQNNVLDLNKTRELIKGNDLTGLEKIKYLQKSILFANCRLDQLLEIAAISQKVVFKKGDIIFHKNDPGDSLYCIVEGKVELNKEGTTFKTIIGKRESFGTLAILDRKPRTATATAESDVIALKISSDDFYNLLADRIKIVQRIFSRLTQEIRTHLETGELGHKKRGRNRFQMISSSTQKKASNE